MTPLRLESPTVGDDPCAERITEVVGKATAIGRLVTNGTPGKTIRCYQLT
jgi:hypothetical protein